MTKKYEMLINGKWTQARSGATREIRDPANGEPLGVVPEAGREDAMAAIDAARAAFDHGPWRKMTALDRSKILFKIGAAIRKEHEMLVELEVRNNGKPRKEAEFDISDAADCFDFYA